MRYHNRNTPTGQVSNQFITNFNCHVNTVIKISWLPATVWLKSEICMSVLFLLVYYVEEWRITVI